MKKTRKQIQKEQTILRNAYVEIAQQTGAIDRITKLMSANYLLISYSAFLVDEIQELLEKYNLTAGKLVRCTEKITKAQEEFFTAYSKLISKEQTINWANDLVAFGELFTQFTNIPAEWEPEKDKIDIEKIEEKYNVKLSINKS